MQCDSMQCSAAQCSAVCNAMTCNVQCAMQWNAMCSKYNGMPCISVLLHLLQGGGAELIDLDDALVTLARVMACLPEVTQCNVQGATQCAMQRSVQCNAMECNATRCNAMQCNAVQCSAMQYAMQYTMQCTLQYATTPTTNSDAAPRWRPERSLIEMAWHIGSNCHLRCGPTQYTMQCTLQYATTPTTNSDAARRCDRRSSRRVRDGGCVA